MLHVSPTTDQPPLDFESSHGRNHRELDDRGFSFPPTLQGHSPTPETKDVYSILADRIDKEQNSKGPNPVAQKIPPSPPLHTYTHT